MNAKKYILTDETIEYCGHTLHRIMALRDFGDVTAGDLGGYIETESNLSHDGNAWVYGDAKVSGNAKVSGHACVSGNAMVAGDACVSDTAKVSGNAMVFGDAWVYGDACVSGDAKVSGNALVYGNALVLGNAQLHNNVRVSGIAWICGPSDIALIEGFGSNFRATTFFRCTDALVRCQCGCFYGTIGEFRSQVRKTHSNSKYAKEYLMIADLMELHFKVA